MTFFMTLKLFHSRKQSGLTHFDLHSALISLMLWVSHHVLQDERTRCDLTQNVTRVRFNVKTRKAGKIKKNLHYVKNTHINCSWGSSTSWPGKNMSTIPGPGHTVSCACPWEPKDCPLIFITGTSCQNGRQNWRNDRWCWFHRRSAERALRLVNTSTC